VAPLWPGSACRASPSLTLNCHYSALLLGVVSWVQHTGNVFSIDIQQQQVLYLALWMMRLNNEQAR
jgi:hypothetical protein